MSDFVSHCLEPRTADDIRWQLLCPQIQAEVQSETYKQRNLVERFFTTLKHYRAVATHFCRHDAVQLAALRIWLRSNEAVT